MLVYQKKNGTGAKALVRVDKLEDVFEDMRERRKGSFEAAIDIQAENEKVEVGIKKRGQKKGYRVMFTRSKVRKESNLHGMYVPLEKLVKAFPEAAEALIVHLV